MASRTIGADALDARGAARDPGCMFSILAAVALDIASPGDVPPPQAIVGGTPADVCDFPADVYIGNGGANCTASLVHPRVLITAAHCLGGLGLAGFGESSFSPEMTVGIQYCEAHPSYYDWGIDLAYCVLAQDAPEVAMVPVIMGCEAEELLPGREIVIAGFGQSNEASGTGGGTKRFTSNTIDSVDTQGGRIYLLGNGNGSCYGDSGGPAYIELADGSWRVIAAVQGPHPQAPPLGCGFGGTYTLIHTQMDWIESASGYDITPCFDADGSWNPDERCTAFPTELHGFGGTWNDLCAAAPLSGAGASCGQPLGDLDPEPDPDPGDESGASIDTGHAPPSFTTGPGDADTFSTETGAAPWPDTSGGADPELDVDPDAPALPAAYGQTGRPPGCRIDRDATPGWAWWCFTLAALRLRSATSSALLTRAARRRLR